MGLLVGLVSSQHVLLLLLLLYLHAWMLLLLRMDRLPLLLCEHLVHLLVQQLQLLMDRGC